MSTDTLLERLEMNGTLDYFIHFIVSMNSFETVNSAFSSRKGSIGNQSVEIFNLIGNKSVKSRSV